MSILDDVYKYAEHILAHKNFQCDRNKEAGYRFYHSRLVANLCVYIIDNASEEDIPEKVRSEMILNLDYICIAALLHDIRKNEKRHAVKAAESLRDIFKNIQLYCNSNNVLNLDERTIILIKDMIRGHGSHGCNDGDNKYYVRLIQDADNISGYINFIPEEVFNNIFDLRKEKSKFFNNKEVIKEKHKRLNYVISKQILNI